MSLQQGNRHGLINSPYSDDVVATGGGQTIVTDRHHGEDLSWKVCDLMCGGTGGNVPRTDRFVFSPRKRAGRQRERRPACVYVAGAQSRHGEYRSANPKFVCVHYVRPQRGIGDLGRTQPRAYPHRDMTTIAPADRSLGRTPSGDYGIQPRPPDRREDWRRSPISGGHVLSANPPVVRSEHSISELAGRDLQ